ncbi:hypothetical protein KIPB_009035, partial [Kipferlia bialata]
ATTNKVLSASLDSNIRAWPAQTTVKDYRKPAFYIRHNKPFSLMCLIPDRNKLWVVMNKQACIYQIASKKFIKRRTVNLSKDTVMTAYAGVPWDFPMPEVTPGGPATPMPTPGPNARKRPTVTRPILLGCKDGEFLTYDSDSGDLLGETAAFTQADTAQFKEIDTQVRPWVTHFSYSEDTGILWCACKKFGVVAGFTLPTNNPTEPFTASHRVLSTSQNIVSLFTAGAFVGTSDEAQVRFWDQTTTSLSHTVSARPRDTEPTEPVVGISPVKLALESPKGLRATVPPSGQTVSPEVRAIHMRRPRVTHRPSRPTRVAALIAEAHVEAPSTPLATSTVPEDQEFSDE